MGEAVSNLETFVWILNHISRFITWSLFILKALCLVKWPISTGSFMWWCQFIDLLKFETHPSSLLNFGTFSPWIEFKFDWVWLTTGYAGVTMKGECADEVYFVYPRCEGVLFHVQASKGLLSVNRCWQSVIVSFDENVQERNCIVLFEFNSTFDICMTVIEVVHVAETGLLCFHCQTRGRYHLVRIESKQERALFLFRT